MSTIAGADKIVFLDDGEILEISVPRESTRDKDASKVASLFGGI